MEIYITAQFMLVTLTHSNTNKRVNVINWDFVYIHFQSSDYPNLNQQKLNFDLKQEMLLLIGLQAHKKETKRMTWGYPILPLNLLLLFNITISDT